MNPNKFLLVALAAMMSIACMCSAQAQSTLVSWDFTVPNYTPDNPYTDPPTPNNGNLGLTSDQCPTTVADGVCTTPLSAPQASNPYGSGFTYNNNGNTYDAMTVYSGVSAPSLGAALAANDYFTFTVSPTAGNILNLTSITVQVGTFQPLANLSSYVLASPTGFTCNNSLGSGANGNLDNAYFINDNLYNPYTVDLTSCNSAAGNSFQGLTGPTEFRVYVPEDAWETVGLQSVTLNGSVETAVPEPSEYGFFVVLAAAAFVLRRKFGRSSPAV